MTAISFVAANPALSMHDRVYVLDSGSGPVSKADENSVVVRNQMLSLVAIVHDLAFAADQVMSADCPGFTTAGYAVILTRAADTLGVAGPTRIEIGDDAVETPLLAIPLISTVMSRVSAPVSSDVGTSVGRNISVEEPSMIIWHETDWEHV